MFLTDLLLQYTGQEKSHMYEKMRSVSYPKTLSGKKFLLSITPLPETTEGDRNFLPCFIFSKLSTNLLIKTEWWRDGKWAEEAEEHSFPMYLYNPNQSTHLPERSVLITWNPIHSAKADAVNSHGRLVHHTCRHTLIKYIT